MLTEVRESACTTLFDLFDHVPQEIRGPLHHTLHEIFRPS